jgi:hypothetical protein
MYGLRAEIKEKEEGEEEGEEEGRRNDDTVKRFLQRREVSWKLPT